MHFRPWRARWKIIWSARSVLPVPGSPAITLIERTGRPPPRMRSKSALPVARRSRLAGIAFTDPLRWWRDDPPRLEAGDLVDTADDELPCHLCQQRPKLADQLPQCHGRVLELPDQNARKRVGISSVGPQHRELVQLRTAGSCPLRGAPHKRGRGG